LKNRERKWKKKRRNNWNFWVQGKNVRLRLRKQLNRNSTDLIMDEIKTRLFMLFWSWHSLGGRRGRDRMIVEFTTTYAISAYHHWCCEFESRSGRGAQHYVITFVSDLRQVGGFLRMFRYPSPLKLKYCWKWR
jgi:hypothetical protein